MTAGNSSVILIGIGNAYRSDDGVGIVVARRLREHVPAGVAILEASGEGAALLDAWTGAATVILVDAVQSGAPPGTIHRLDANSGPIPSRFFHYSTHSFSVAEAVELARALNQLPPRLIVYGIEGKNFADGESLSDEVERAAVRVAEQALADALPFVEGGGKTCTNSP
jgi:hydrogenase maturation protease